MKRTMLIGFSVMILLSGIAAAVRWNAKAADDSSNEHWEYLVVSGANNVNFSAPSTGSMRKEASGFQRENFVLEMNMDRLGEKGWQLVSVVVTEREPIYYFRRRK
jgi:hypothetical protein